MANQGANIYLHVVTFVYGDFRSSLLLHACRVEDGLQNKSLRLNKTLERIRGLAVGFKQDY